MLIFLIFFANKQKTRYEYYGMLLSGEKPLYEKLIMQQEENNENIDISSTSNYISLIYRCFIYSNILIFLPSACYILYIQIRIRLKTQTIDSNHYQNIEKSEVQQKNTENILKTFHSFTSAKYAVNKANSDLKLSLHNYHIINTADLPKAFSIYLSPPKFSHHEPLPSYEIQYIREKYKEVTIKFDQFGKSTLSDEFGWY